MNAGETNHHHGGTHYVVSEDIDVIVKRWCGELGLTPPPIDTYVGLRSKMKSFLEEIFSKVTFIDSGEIRAGLLSSIEKHRLAGLTVVNLERVYLDDSEVDTRIELTRTVNEQGDDIVMPSVRHGTRNKGRQFESLSNKKIALIDDVVFSGKTLVTTIADLQQYNALTHSVTVAIGIADGVRRLKRATFGVTGMPDHMTIECIEEFDHVSDQVCERDFYPGLPYSGRQLASHEHFSLPYVLPFGMPGKWASIPEKEIKAFSILCLKNTIALFREIEKINRKTVPSAMVPRPVLGIVPSSRSFADILEEKCNCL